jgi:hypothetical protein
MLADTSSEAIFGQERALTGIPGFEIAFIGQTS